MAGKSYYSIRNFVLFGLALFVSHMTGAVNKVVVENTGKGSEVSCTVLDPRYATPATETIASSLLLESDIRGGIEDASWYFDNSDEIPLSQRKKGMESLLLTQGWSRYDIPSSVASSYQEPESPLEKSAEMSGVVKSRWRGKPLDNAVFNVISPQVNFGALAVTDSLGRFSLPYPDYPEGTRYLLQSLNTDGNPEANYVMDQQQFPAIPVLFSLYSTPSDINPSTEIDYSWRIKNNYGMMNISLGGVTVYGYSQDSPSDYYEAFANRTFSPADFKRNGINNIETAVRSIKGLAVINGNIFSRGRYVSIWVDGVEYDPDDIMKSIHFNEQIGGRSVLDYMSQMFRAPTLGKDMESGPMYLTKLAGQYSLDDFKKIEFFDSNNALIFQQPFHSSGGVLMFTTNGGMKSRNKLPWHFQVYEPLGYQPKCEFYTPKYELMPEGDLNARPTLYWMPRAEFDADGRLELSLPSDVKEAYVSVEGIADDGTPVSYSKKINNDK